MENISYSDNRSIYNSWWNHCCYCRYYFYFNGKFVRLLIIAFPGKSSDLLKPLLAGGLQDTRKIDSISAGKDWGPYLRLNSLVYEYTN